MAEKPTRGYPLLADISGFVQFVNESEIEHANEIIRELLGFIIVKINSLFTVAQIDGDAIFAYAPQERIFRGEAVFELIESTYTAYKDQLLQVSRVRTCSCNACRNTSKLDLKFAVHYGEYIPSEFQKQFDLIGLAPYFIRKREWKEPVKEATQWQGYALFTEESLKQLNLQPDDLQLKEIPGGSVRTFGLDLEARYKSMLEQRHVKVSPEEAHYSFSFDFPISRDTLWDWVNDPDKRTQWYILKWSAQTRPGGRTGSGAVNHCYHGIGDTLETILDWRPFEYFTSEFRVRPSNTRLQETFLFERVGDKTSRLHVYIKPADEKTGWLTKFLARSMAIYQKRMFARLEKMVNST